MSMLAQLKAEADAKANKSTDEVLKELAEQMDGSGDYARVSKALGRYKSLREEAKALWPEATNNRRVWEIINILEAMKGA